MEDEKLLLEGTIHSLTIIWNEKLNLITEFQFSEDFPQDVKTKLALHLDNSLLIETEAFSQRILFTGVKLKRYFRLHDNFQIIPIPQNWPQSNIKYDQHPLIIQFKYKKVADVMIDNARQNRMFLHYVTLLNIFLKNVFIYNQSGGMAVWGKCSHSDKPEQVYLGYMHQDANKPINGFADVEGLEFVEMIKFQDYYLESNYAHQDFVFPDNIIESFDLAFRLPDNLKLKYWSACRWFEIATDTWKVSRSASFVGYVSGLEAFLDQPEICPLCKQLISSSVVEGESCNVCHQPRLKLNSRFLKMLSDYGIDESFKREKKLLYKTRSSLAHGGYILDADNVNRYNFSRKSNMESDLHRRLSYICMIVAHNWLRKNS